MTWVFFSFFLNMLLRKLNLRHSKSAVTAVNSRFRGQFLYQYFIPVAVPARDRGVINHLHSAWNKPKMLLKRRVIFCVRMIPPPLPHLKQVLKSRVIHQFMQKHCKNYWRPTSCFFLGHCCPLFKYTQDTSRTTRYTQAVDWSRKMQEQLHFFQYLDSGKSITAAWFPTAG